MRTRGSQVFDRLRSKPPLTATRLSKLLTRVHGANEEEPTDIVHPSPVSLLALELMFHHGSTEWSPHSDSLFAEIHRLCDMFVVYGLLDMLYTVQAKMGGRLIPVLNQNQISSMIEAAYTLVMNTKPTSDEAVENVQSTWLNHETKRNSTRIMNALELTNAIGRLEVLSRRMDLGIRLFFALGVIPISSASSNIDSHNIYLEGSFIEDELAQAFDTYLGVLEVNAKTFSILDIDNVKNDLLLISRHDGYSATNYSGEQYDLWSFERLLETHSALPPAYTVIHSEIYHVYAANESKSYILERMQRTNIIVSSELSGEVKSILKAQHESKSTDTAATDVKGVAMRIAKGDRALSALEAKAQLLHSDITTPGVHVDAASGAARIQTETRVLNELISANERLEKKLRRMGAVGLEHNMSDEQSTSVITTKPVVTIPFNQLAVGSKDEERSKRAAIRSMQEQELGQSLKKAIAKLSTSKREVDLLRNESAQLMANNERLELHVNALKNNETLLRQETKIAMKRAVELEGVNTKLAEIVKQMRTTVSAISNEIQLSEVDRERLMHLFTENGTLGNTAVSLNSWQGEARFIQNIMREAMSVIGLNGPMRITECEAVKKLKRQNDMVPIAFERVLNSFNGRPLAIFPDVHTEERLRAVNKMLPEWIHDRVVRDQLSAIERAVALPKESVPEKSSFSTRPVIATDDVYLIDVNPRSERDIDHTMRALEACNAISPDHGNLLVENLYRYNYLNIQYRAKGDLDSVIHRTLKDKWDHLTKTFLFMNEKSYTSTGQVLNSRVGIMSVHHFVAPFYAQLAGVRGHSHRLPHIVDMLERKFGQTSLEACDVREAGRPHSNISTGDFSIYTDRDMKLVDFFCREQLTKLC